MHCVFNYIIACSLFWRCTQKWRNRVYSTQGTWRRMRCCDNVLCKGSGIDGCRRRKRDVCSWLGSRTGRRSSTFSSFNFPLNLFLLLSQAHCAVISLVGDEPLSLDDGFRSVFELVSAGLFLPGSFGNPNPFKLVRCTVATCEAMCNTI